jgi:hypothetical protein
MGCLGVVFLLVVAILEIVMDVAFLLVDCNGCYNI